MTARDRLDDWLDRSGDLLAEIGPIAAPTPAAADPAAVVEQVRSYAAWLRTVDAPNPHGIARELTRIVGP